MIQRADYASLTDLTPFFSTGSIYINDFPTTPTGHRGEADMTLVRCNRLYINSTRSNSR